MNVNIKPGDVVSFEHTPRTRMNLIMADVLCIKAGVTASYVLVDGKDVRQLNYK
jgi:hypothetical protein